MCILSEQHAFFCNLFSNFPTFIFDSILLAVVFYKRVNILFIFFGVSVHMIEFRSCALPYTTEEEGLEEDDKSKILLLPTVKKDIIRSETCKILKAHNS